MIYIAVTMSARERAMASEVSVDTENTTPRK
jgi:hypothetical protein